MAICLTGAIILAVSVLVFWMSWRQQRKHEATRFILAIQRRDSEALMAVLMDGLDVRELPDFFGDPALILAARWPGAVAALLDRGADVDERGTGWMTALMHAAADRNEDVCELLLAHGADADARDLFGRSADWWAEQAGIGAAFRALRRRAR